MKYLNLPFIISLLLMYSYAPSAQALQEVRVSGIVQDPLSAVIPKVKLAFRSKDLHREAVADQEGRYEIILPVGTYQVTTQAEGFCVARRIPFRVEGTVDLMINLTLDLAPSISACTASEGEKFVLAHRGGIPVELQIRHGQRVKSGGKLVYKQPQYYYSVEVNYDVLTMYADQVWFDKDKLKIEAEGHVIIDDGKQRQKFSMAEVNLNPEKLTFDYKGR